MNGGEHLTCHSGLKHRRAQVTPDFFSLNVRP